MTADPHLELAPLAALGALDGEEWSAFQAHAAGCPACRAELAAHEAVARRIALAVPRVEPPSALRQRVLDATLPDRVRSVAPARGWWFPALASAAAVVLGIGLLVVRSQRDAALRDTAIARQALVEMEGEVGRARAELAALRSSSGGAGEASTRTVAALEAELGRAREDLASVRQQLSADVTRARQTADAMATEVRRVREDLASARQGASQEKALNEVLTHPEARMARLEGLPAAPGARGRVVWNPATREAILIASGLEQAPAGKAYEVWVIAQAAPVPAGVFQPGADGRAVFRLPVVDDTARVKTFAVTIEPAAGTPAPTGPMVLAGTVS